MNILRLIRSKWIIILLLAVVGIWFGGDYLNINKEVTDEVVQQENVLSLL